MCRWKNKAVYTGIMVLLLFVRPVLAQVSEEDRHFLSPQYSKKISMDFKDAALTDVLKIFSRQSGMNFIAAQDVGNKKITLFFENIPVEEALEKILSANDLTYDMPPGGDIFTVHAKVVPKDEVITRVYHLKHATVPSSKLNSTISISSASSSDSSSSSSSSSSSGSSSGSSSSGASSSAATAESQGLFAAVKAVLTKAGILVEDPRTNSLVVTDVTSQFPLIEETIAKLDVPVPQVLIEVQMLDISKTTSDLMGVKFGNNPLSFTGASKSTIWPFNQSQYLGKEGTEDMPAPSSGSTTTGSSLGPYQLGTISASGMTAVLNFLQTRTDTKNLARPRLLTLNNETAEIKISTDEAIGITTTTFSSSSAASSAVEAERVQTGVFLTVTPQADLATREIIMAVYPKVIQARAGATFAGQTFKDPEERGSQSLLKIHDGETIIIGGLLRTDESNTLTKVPILGDIPLLGMAFRHKDKTGTKRELMIFLTPHIIDDESKSALVRRDHKAPPKEEDKAQVSMSRSGAVNKALSTIEQQRF